ncbi:hypothetical protein [Neorhodopirellula pilleata]|nr:hypothetical protein [Neorhodopirellula pilleata]
MFVSFNESVEDIEEQLRPVQEILTEFPAERWRHVESWKYEFAANK